MRYVIWTDVSHGDIKLQITTVGFIINWESCYVYCIGEVYSAPLVHLKINYAWLLSYIFNFGLCASTTLKQSNFKNFLIEFDLCLNDLS